MHLYIVHLQAIQRGEHMLHGGYGSLAVAQRRGQCRSRHSSRLRVDTAHAGRGVRKKHNAGIHGSRLKLDLHISAGMQAYACERYRAGDSGLKHILSSVMPRETRGMVYTTLHVGSVMEPCWPRCAERMVLLRHRRQYSLPQRQPMFHTGQRQQQAVHRPPENFGKKRLKHTLPDKMRNADNLGEELLFV